LSFRTENRQEGLLKRGIAKHMSFAQEIIRLSDTLSELPVTSKEGMLVPARIYATSSLLESMD
jgi:hypothetical protein